MTEEPIRPGQTVYWHDPDGGLCSGYAVVLEVRNRECIVLGVEGGGIVEAHIAELEEA